MKSSGKTNRPPGWPNLHRAGSGEGGKTYIYKEEPKGQGLSLCLSHCLFSLSLSLSLSLSHCLALSSSRLLGQHALTPQGCIFLRFLNKTEV